VSVSFGGSLLVSTPALHDPSFRRTVVLLLDHDEDGALGVVLNRPTEIPVADVLPVWADHVSEPDVVFHGGPVAQDSALGLARGSTGATDAEVGWRALTGDLGLVDLDAPPEVLVPALAGLRIYVGYSGWGAGQLEDELAEDAWWVFPADPDDMFAGDPDRLWQRVLRRQGGDAALAATLPDDPSLN
jgi:putative transcriptional regulator